MTDLPDPQEPLPATIDAKRGDGKEAALAFGITRNGRRIKMTSKPKRRSTRKVKSLKVKSVGKDHAKQIKGGPNGPQWIKASFDRP
jgi:hypothetical protein